MTDMSARPHFSAMLERCKPLPALKTALVCPHETTALGGALEARDLGLIEPILVGEPKRIKKVATDNGFNIDGLTIVEAEGEQGAAHIGVDCVVDGRAQAIMKGDVHSDTYLSAIIRRDNGMRTDSRTSHCFVMDIPDWPKPIIITDAALNVAPDVKNRIAITRNAIALAHALGVETPKVAVLSAVESVNAAIPSSAEAEQIATEVYDGAVVGGPFALDNAVSMRAAKLKGITDPAAGDADILVVPTIEAGNILFKALVYMAGAETGGLVVGASAPVILTSRADSAEARIASCALAVLAANTA